LRESGPCESGGAEIGGTRLWLELFGEEADTFLKAEEIRRVHRENLAPVFDQAPRQSFAHAFGFELRYRLYKIVRSP
jgi:hypothetical protein